MNRLSVSLVLMLLMSASGSAQRPPADYVNPRLGTGGHGHTYPGATVPFGMVQLSPDNGKNGWDWCSGYHWSCDTIVGFSHTHLSGTGCADLGDIQFTPCTRTPVLSSPTVATFSHADEFAGPGYYSVRLSDNVFVELTATERVGVHRYHFGAGDSAFVRIDLGYGQEDSPTECGLTIENDSTISGYRYSSGWSPEQRLYFVARFSRSLRASVLQRNEPTVTGLRTATGKAVQAALYFGNSQQPLLAKVGISAVSVDGARRNLAAELPGWDFDECRVRAREHWNAALSRISVESVDEAQRVTFYTALYHSFLAPTLFCDTDSTYRGGDGLAHDGAFLNYCTFSLWDTYRAAHPLYTIVQPERVNDFVNSLLVFHDQHGNLPVWSLAGDETWCMIGYHAVPVIADAYQKGFTGFDAQRALAAMKASAGDDRRGLEYYNRVTPQPLDTLLAKLNSQVIEVPEDFRRAAISGDAVVPGYAESIAGETIHYHSSYPYVNDALLVRATDGTMSIEWKTAPLPRNIEQHAVTFMWVAGHATYKGGHRFELYGNGEKWLSFTTATDTSRLWWSEQGANGTQLIFCPSYIDQFDDLFGECYLTVPTKLLKRGEPLTLKIVGENGNSSDWYMTFQHASRDTLSLVQEYALADDDGTLFQIFRLQYEHLTASAAVAELNYGRGLSSVEHRTLPGLSHWDFPVQALTEPTSGTIRIVGANSLPQHEVTLLPVVPVNYIPGDKERESVSKSLEYAYDDWCIAQLASTLGRTEDAEYFQQRAGYWENLYDGEAGFMRGKTFDGKWVSPFNPRFGTGKQPEYTEGNAWQYSWYVPQDVRGLIEIMGGNDKFAMKLDWLFTQDSEVEDEGATADMTGLIGLYAHGNEPSHHIAYLYDFCGQPWKTQELTRRIMREFYTDQIDGLCGNEDCGQMSAWYVFSALGFYPVNPADGKYWIGSPLVRRAAISVGAGRTFEVIADHQSEQNVYIQSATLNGSEFDRLYITHAELMGGGELRFQMGPEPNRSWGHVD
ncbi:glycoside hydrolase family 92 protein [candidate division KSB1 bacterium]|nr:glycoside hydrolase family 92 protein [candidate division KSB1 bacterium]